MKVLLLGGTGLIGRAVSKCLAAAGADISILCRNRQSQEKAESLGAKPIAGDIAEPNKWHGRVASFDAVIHMACTFESDMPEIDQRLCRALVEKLSIPGKNKTLIYTGGTWLYADSAGKAITENTPFSPLQGFEWMVVGANYIQQAKEIRGMTIHPAVVVDDPDGIPQKIRDDYKRSGEIAIPVSKNLVWPIVDVNDLAETYKLLLEKGTVGESYHAAGIEAASVYRLAERLIEREGLNVNPVIKPIEYWIDTNSETISGYALSQKLDSAKLRQLGWQPKLNHLR